MKVVLVMKGSADVEAAKDLRAPEVAQRVADWFGKNVQKPWGSERLMSSTPGMNVWQLYMNAGAETSMHCHPSKETMLVVLVGEVTLATLNGSHIMKAPAMARIDAGAFHKSSTGLGAIVLEIESTGDKYDLLRLADKYGRENKGYTE